ncbi:MAG: methylated-DNA--[protein]-cysteine S-methyltransferase [Halieaceae bacterium]|jgi:AraC family transcriptional regulator of adaptative response/methylated-DNA-[protein]-cysteine methyltransferase|nr:methylated-DNA--[protein]-cysteine S-methyltransferase [Halieaceae bacterium]
MGQRDISKTAEHRVRSDRLRGDGETAIADADRAHRHYHLVADAIEYLRSHQGEQPELSALAAELDVSEAHLQRVFSAWAGISPKRFLQSLTRDVAVDALRRSASLLEASLAAGLSGPSRLHDLTLICDAMTPGEIARGGAGLELTWGWAACPFGVALLAFGERGLCELAFHDAAASRAAELLHGEWPAAQWRRDDVAAQALADRIFERPLERGRLHLMLRGSNFQLRVWKALLAVGEGQRVSYAQLADLAGRPGAARAVGSAMARNRIAYLIPCHRVIRGDGDVGDYRWGVNRKLALQGWESVRSASA